MKLVTNTSGDRVLKRTGFNFKREEIVNKSLEGRAECQVESKHQHLRQERRHSFHRRTLQRKKVIRRKGQRKDT